MDSTNNLLQAIVEGADDVIYARDLTGRYILMNASGARFLLRPLTHIIGSDVRVFFPTEVAEQLIAEDRAIIASGKSMTSEVVLPLPGGERIFQSVKSPWRDENGKIIGIIGVSRDITEQRRQTELSAANRKLLDEIEERRNAENRANALVRIGRKLNSTLDLNAILEMLSREATTLIDAESGFAGLRTADGMAVRAVFHQGRMTPFAYTWLPGQGMPGWVLEHKRPYLTNDAQNDPVILRHLEINANVRSALCTPILDTHNEVMGFFDIRNKKDGAGFTSKDQHTLLTLSPVASISIQNAIAYQKIAWAEAALKSSYEEVRALAARLESVREDERTHIARELHDGLGQSLTALKFDLASLVSRLAKMDMALRDKAQAITSQIDGTIKTVRRISTELRPGMLDDFGLAAAIEWHAQEFQERTGIFCDCDALMPEPPLSRAQATALFRIFQETMTNVARHAGATRVRISLLVEDKALQLQVEDNGRGMPPGALAGTHSLGLVGMRERASLLDGSLVISETPGGGTTVQVSIPLLSIASDDEELVKTHEEP